MLERLTCARVEVLSDLEAVSQDYNHDRASRMRSRKNASLQTAAGITRPSQLLHLYRGPLRSSVPAG